MSTSVTAVQPSNTNAEANAAANGAPVKDSIDDINEPYPVIKVLIAIGSEGGMHTALGVCAEFSEDVDNQRKRFIKYFLLKNAAAIIAAESHKAALCENVADIDHVVLSDAFTLATIAAGDGTCMQRLMQTTLAQDLAVICERYAVLNGTKAFGPYFIKIKWITSVMLDLADMTTKPALKKAGWVPLLIKHSMSMVGLLRASAFSTLGVFVADEAVHRQLYEAGVIAAALKMLGEYDESATHQTETLRTAVLYVRWRVFAAEYMAPLSEEERAAAGADAVPELDKDIYPTVGELLQRSPLSMRIPLLRAINLLCTLNTLDRDDLPAMLVDSGAVPHLVKLIKPDLEDGTYLERAALECAVSTLGAVAMNSRNAAVQALLHEGIAPIFILLGKTTSRPCKQACLEALSALTATPTVAAMIFNMLAQQAAGLSNVVALCADKAGEYSICFNAAATLAFLALEEGNLPLLNAAGALEAIEQFTENHSTANFSYTNTNISKNGFNTFVRLLKSEDVSLLSLFAFICARVTFIRSTQFGGAALQQHVRGTLVPQLRMLSHHRNANIRKLAATALGNLGDRLYLDTVDTQSWIKSLGVVDTNSVLQTFASEEIDFQLLIRLGVEAANDLLRRVKVSEGARARMLVSVGDVLEADRRAKERIPDIVAALSATTVAAAQADKSHAPASKAAATDATGHRRTDVFLSYCWADKPTAQRIRLGLEQAGFATWMDEGSLHGGSQLWADIDKALSTAKVVVSCVSTDYSKSRSCAKEVSLADDRMKLVIPVLVGPLADWPPRGAMGPVLSGKIYIDLSTNEKFDAVFPSVVEATRQCMTVV